MPAKTKAYAEGIRAEWKKIVWPSKEETAKKTAKVVVASAALGAAIAVMDMGFQFLVNFVAGLM